MSAFVYDYDHNAPTLEHLQATHERMLQTIRAAQPKLPVLMLILELVQETIATPMTAALSVWPTSSAKS